MEVESDSWSNASLDEIKVNTPIKDTKQSLIQKNIMFSNCLMSTILKIINNSIIDTSKGKVLNLQNDFNKAKRIMDIKDFNTKLSYLKLNKINARILLYFNIKTSKLIDTNIQCIALDSILNANKKRNGDIAISFFLDGYIENSSICYAKKNIHTSFINNLLNFVGIQIRKKMGIEEKENFLADHNKIYAKIIEEDLKILNSIPNSLQFIKKHPIFALDSLLPENKTIFPKRKVLGLFKGEKVYSRESVQNLYTERQLFKQGRVPKKDGFFFKKYKNLKLYLLTQSENIVILNLEHKKNMIFFHKNFLPRNCVHKSSNYAVKVAKILKINYSECIISFNFNIPIIKGIFIEKEDERIFDRSFYEFIARKKMNNILWEGRIVFKTWRLFKRTYEKMQDIKKRIGL